MRLYSLQLTVFIPEQFTVKAHPALFEGEREGRDRENRETLFPANPALLGQHYYFKDSPANQAILFQC